LGIVILEEPVDGGLEVGDGSEDAAFETAIRQEGEPYRDSNLRRDPLGPRSRHLVRRQRSGNIIDTPTPINDCDTYAPREGGLFSGQAKPDDRSTEAEA
jgi:hypothetical protein